MELFPPPLFIVVDLHHKTNNRDHLTRLYRSVSLSCCIVSFFPLFTCLSCSSLSSYSYQYSYSLSIVIVESLLKLIRMHLSCGANVVIHSIRHYFIDQYYCNVSDSTGTANDLCIRTDPISDLIKAMHCTLIRRNTIKQR